jgi:hypothetical protein
MEVMLTILPGHGSDADRSSLRVVAYRDRSIRLACRKCGLRFSIDPANYATVIATKMGPPPGLVEKEARKNSAGDPGRYLEELAKAREVVQRVLQAERDRVLNLHIQGLKAAKPRKRPIRFPKRVGARAQEPS